MRKYWILIISGIIVFILQSAFSQVLNIRGWTPDFLIILIFVIALKYNITITLIFAFLAGILQDYINTDMQGISSFSNVVAAYVAFYFRDIKITTGLYASGLLAVCFVKSFLFYFLFSIGSHFQFWVFIYAVVIPQSIYTLVLGMFIFLIFKNIILKELHNEF